MSFQWSCVAGFLYFEIAIVMLMILPIFSPRRWHQLFKSRLFVKVYEYAAVYFFIFLGVLCLFLFDAIKDINKYSQGKQKELQLSTEMVTNIKLFRSQRNFYITGFAIFLTFVIRRLITMLIIQDELNAKVLEIIKKTESTVQLAKTTVLENTLRSENYNEIEGELEKAETLVVNEIIKVKALEDEATKWRLKYEELVCNQTGRRNK